MEKFYRTGDIPREWKQKIKGGTNNRNYWSDFNPKNLFSDTDFNSPQFRAGGGRQSVGVGSKETSGGATTNEEENQVISGVLLEEDENTEQNELQGNNSNTTQTMSSVEEEGVISTGGKSGTATTSKTTSSKNTDTSKLTSNKTTKFIDTKLNIKDAIGVFIYIVVFIFSFFLGLLSQTTTYSMMSSQIFFLSLQSGVLMFFSIYLGIRGMLFAYHTDLK